MTQKPKNKKISVSGIVIPSSWDSNGTPCGTAVSAFNETEYELDNGTSKKNLLEYLEKPVHITGFLENSGPLKQKIFVGSIRLIKKSL